jgi:hypothetical protein
MIKWRYKLFQNETIPNVIFPNIKIPKSRKNHELFSGFSSLARLSQDRMPVEPLTLSQKSRKAIPKIIPQKFGNITFRIVSFRKSS